MLWKIETHTDKQAIVLYLRVYLAYYKTIISFRVETFCNYGTMGLFPKGTIIPRSKPRGKGHFPSLCVWTSSDCPYRTPPLIRVQKHIE